MTTRPPFHKRKYLINYRFQFQIIGFFLFCYSTVVLTLYYIMRESILSSSLNMSTLECDKSFDEYKVMQIEVLNFNFLSIGLIGFVFTFIGGIFLSHKIAGPLYRLRFLMSKASERLGSAPAAELGKVEGRKNDYFLELFKEFDRLTTALGFNDKK